MVWQCRKPLTKGVLQQIVYTGKVGVEQAVNSMNVGAFTLIQIKNNDVLIKKFEKLLPGQSMSARHYKIKQAQQKIAMLSDKQVAEMVADGKTSSEIAELLFISKRTVDIHPGHIFEKLDIKSVANLIQLVLIANL